MNSVKAAREEFLLDSAHYFADKSDLYLSLKERIAADVYADISDVRICGSAYWGRRFRDESPFLPGVSDLDVAIISPQIFCRCMSEVRDLSKNFSDQSVFPKVTGKVSTFELFRDYAFGKGLIRTEHLPNVRTRRGFIESSDRISRDFASHFEKISFALYDSALSFANKQAGATRKFRK
ncbi:hypothetical protein [Pseudooceanicola marinus]|nr:hypothetical protein [Pseudooceanicola marinus]